jgi:flagellar biosynthetic protein FliR
MTLAINLGWLEAFGLSAVRMVAFLVIAPPFSTGAFPLRVKGMLAVGLALAVSPRAAEQYVQGSPGDFLVALVLELVAGALLGFLVFVAFSAVQSAGSLIDLFGGFSLAQGFDPQSMVNGAQFARLFQMTAIALLFASGGYLLVMGGLIRSFEAIPVGSALSAAITGPLLIEGTGQMLLAAVQIAGPLIVVLFLADVGMGLLTRVAPALNAFALSFPLKVLLTLVLAVTTFVGLPAIVESLTGDALELMGGAR